MGAYRMGPDEYFWSYEFRFDLRDATRSEQEAVRTVFLAQRLELDGFTPKHIEIVELVLGRDSEVMKFDGLPTFYKGGGDFGDDPASVAAL